MKKSAAKAKSTIGLLLSASLLAACGASRNSAPIVYGTQPSAPTRIYNSPADVYKSPSEKARLRAAAAEPARPAPPPDGQGAGVLTSTVYAEALPIEPVLVSGAADAAVGTNSGAGTNASAGAAPAARRWSTTEPDMVRVAAGDTVYAISRRTGASPKAIIAENGLKPPYTLEIGETLRIPRLEAKVANTLQDGAPAPVDRRSPAQTRATAFHVVARGDTLYAISRSTGLGVQEIAKANGLRPPYRLAIGDRLALPGKVVPPTRAVKSPEPVVIEAARVQPAAYAAASPAPAPAPSSTSIFDWPVKGAIIGSYGDGDLGKRNDGINIAAPVGTPVRAAADGEIVYRGSELEGYGNLILIKHEDGFVTAYAHNDVLLVRKGQSVRQGQVIAKVGKTGSAPEPQLHFEIRQNLKSVDPLAFLQ